VKVLVDISSLEVRTFKLALAMDSLGNYCNVLLNCALSEALEIQLKVALF
jgi:hypothetical protein